MINTDQGSQFTSAKYAATVADSDIRHSMDRRGGPTDNVTIERFWRSLKYANIYLYGYESNLDLFLGITEYEPFYNHHRKHQRLDRKVPAVVYRTGKSPPEYWEPSNCFIHLRST